MQDVSSGVPSSHEANYNLVAAALATAAATMLTLLTTLGTTGLVLGNPLLKILLESELLVIELALIFSVVSLIRRGEKTKRQLVLASAFLVVLGTLLLWVSATIIILSA
ncbi:MAG: hypothetical protein OK455_00215 [Thaumarchaeota archaeon]|nr:hypothetical protein [Nitrososphaerota archaeon]